MRKVGIGRCRYRKLIDRMFGEIAAKVPGFVVSNHQAGILISSPDAQVYDHHRCVDRRAGGAAAADPPPAKQSQPSNSPISI